MDKLFCLSDQVIGNGGLYALWCILYLCNIVALSTDSTGVPGDSSQSAINTRQFNFYTSLISHIYLFASSSNIIYGNTLPSSFMAISGHVHQFSFWLILSYYRGDIFHNWGAVAVINTILCCVVTVFTFDTVIKSWAIVLWPKRYRDYVEKWTKKPTQSTPAASA